MYFVNRSVFGKGEKFAVAQLTKEFFAIYGTRKFSAVFITVNNTVMDRKSHPPQPPPMRYKK
jgi:hypothetical protein